MLSLESLIPVVAAAIGTVAGAIVTPLTLLSKGRKQRAEKTLIGVVKDVEIPAALSALRRFTSYQKAVRSSDRVVVLLTRTVSYALRKCDFVVFDESSDGKVHPPKDIFWETLNVSE